MAIFLVWWYGMHRNREAPVGPNEGEQSSARRAAEPRKMTAARRVGRARICNKRSRRRESRNSMMEKVFGFRWEMLVGEKSARVRWRSRGRILAIVIVLMGQSAIQAASGPLGVAKDSGRERERQGGGSALAEQDNGGTWVKRRQGADELYSNYAVHGTPSSRTQKWRTQRT